MTKKKLCLIMKSVMTVTTISIVITIETMVAVVNDDEDDANDNDNPYLRSGEVEAPRAESTSSMECGDDCGRGEEGEKEDDILVARCRGRQPSTSSSCRENYNYSHGQNRLEVRSLQDVSFGKDVFAGYPPFDSQD